MASKRQRKKQEKKRLQKQVLSFGYNPKQAEQLSYKSLLNISRKEEQKQQKRKRAKDSKNKLRRRKAEYLESHGISLEGLTLKQIDAIKVKDIENGVKPIRSGDKIGYFDFDKVYTLKDGKRFYFAYCDLSGERSFEEIIDEFSSLTNEQLLKRLEYIVNQPTTYQRGSKRNGVPASGSSGKAGTYKFVSAEQSVIEMFNRQNYNEKRRKPKSKRKTHKGGYKGFQVLKNGSRNSFDKVTPRNLLIIANAILYNIMETERKPFYNRFYIEVQKHMKDFSKLLPKP